MADDENEDRARDLEATRGRAVPSGRIARIAAFGQLAGGVAGGALAEGARRLSRGERPRARDMLLTPANVGRVTEQLSRLRGAAMKLGQMVSMDGGDVLPPELTAIMARLRQDAHRMPPRQLDTVLAAEWGRDWRRRFRQFDATPIAAASIGQVHRATLPDGRRLAIKVQYPGVAQSIDADVDNVATLLRVSGLLPASLPIAPLLAEAKLQLHEEADYRREAEQMRRYHAMLAGEPAFVVPLPLDELTTGRVLAMDLIEARAIDALEAEPQAVREEVMGRLLDLVLRELLVFGFMQTDPNFANYRYQPDQRRLVLLDFGAAREVPADLAHGYRALLRAGLAGDAEALKRALLDVGFVSETVIARHGARLDTMIAIILDHAGRPGLLDFADRSFVPRLRAEGEAIGADREAWHLPPAPMLFIQRKISGTALLAARMKVRLPVFELAQRHAG